MLNSYYEYMTLSGDTFDSIALDFYDEENFSIEIIKANPSYRNVILFNGGEILKIPILEEKAAESLPPWKRVNG